MATLLLINPLKSSVVVGFLEHICMSGSVGFWSLGLLLFLMSEMDRNNLGRGYVPGLQVDEL